MEIRISPKYQEPPYVLEAILDSVDIDEIDHNEMSRTGFLLGPCVKPVDVNVRRIPNGMENARFNKHYQLEISIPRERDLPLTIHEENIDYQDAPKDRKDFNLLSRGLIRVTVRIAD